MYDGLGIIFDVDPVLARELTFGTDHRAERQAIFQLWGCPGIPIMEGGDGPGVVHFIEGMGNIGSISPIPEEAALCYRHDQKLSTITSNGTNQRTKVNV